MKIFNTYYLMSLVRFNLPDQLLSNSTNVQDVYNSILVSISKRNRVQ